MSQAYRKKFAALLSGIVVFAIMMLANPFALDPKAAKVLAIASLMITWWVMEALPMPVVALLPPVLFPLMGIAKVDQAAAPYANPVIFLFLGGFMIGLAIEKWNLHKRIALSIVTLTGTSGNRIVLGFILATGFLSMWLSNTATTMMMYPIAMSVIKVMEDNHSGITSKNNNLAVCLLLAIAYASNFGGIATIIGTPPNVAYVAFLEKHNGYAFQFIDWMKLCLPLSIILLFSLYFVMTRLYPVRMAADGTAGAMIKTELRDMGKLSKPERRVLSIFILTAALWITKDIVNAAQKFIVLDDTMIAVLGAILLFIVPAQNDKYLLEWKDTEKMSWGILLLFGGGISLANQLEQAGLIQSLGRWVAGYANGGFMLVFLVALLSIFVSEVMSNVAQVIVFAPVIAGIAEGVGADALQLGMAMTLGASCAGMMPMGTPPNAIVFASGRLKLKHMTTTGFVMNVVSAALITLFCWFLLPGLVRAIS